MLFSAFEILMVHRFIDLVLPSFKNLKFDMRNPRKSASIIFLTENESLIGLIYRSK
jgi:hypothetical protein